MGEAEIAADQVDQIGAISAIEHGEGRVQRERLCMAAQQPVADRMKCTRPGQQRGLCAAESLATSARNKDLLCPAGHFQRSAAGKGQQQQTTGVRAVEYQPRHPVR